MVGAFSLIRIRGMELDNGENNSLCFSPGVSPSALGP
jgi:hypothetical protein